MSLRWENIHIRTYFGNNRGGAFVFRPGTFLICRAAANINVKPSSRTLNTGG